MPLQRCPSTGLLSSKVGVALGSFVGSLVEGEPLGPAVGDPVAGFKVGAALGFGVGLFAAGASLGFSEGDEELGGSAEGGDWLLPLLLGGRLQGGFRRRCRDGHPVQFAGRRRRFGLGGVCGEKGVRPFRHS